MSKIFFNYNNYYSYKMTNILFWATAFTTLPMILGNANFTDLMLDDVSLSEDLNNTVRELPDDVQSVVNRVAVSVAKRYKKRLNDIEPTYNYYTFRHAIDEMKDQASKIFPEFERKSVLSAFIALFKKGVPLPKDVEASIKLFSKVEDNYCQDIEPTEHATKQIPSFFYTMLALLMRCKEEEYETNLVWLCRERALRIRAALFKLHGVDENDDEHLLPIYTKFSSSYARSRHLCESIHHYYAQVHEETKKLEIKLKRPVQLAEVLGFLGVLQAWNFSKEDLVHANIIREVLTPSTKCPFLSSPYNVTILGEMNETPGRNAGILPYIKHNVCPRL